MNIAYSHTWEDASVLIKALQINEEDTVLSVTSGGCNTLAIANLNPKTIFSIDYNKEQNYLLELKLASINNLEKTKALSFLGYKSCNNRNDIFNSLKKHINDETINYWNKNINAIQNGIVHSGKFENYLSLFRNYILPFVHSKKTIGELVKPKNKTNQVKFYDYKWNSFRWKLLFKVFFSKVIMSRFGRPKKMFTYNKIDSIAKIYSNRVKNAFREGIISNNFYLNYILFKECKELPLYLENYKNINPEIIKISTIDILSFLKSMPDNSISKFNLSDIFEPITQEEMNIIIDELYRVAKPNARIIFWNNLVYRDINYNKLKYFYRDINLEDELRRQDKIFFYELFYIYSVLK